MSTGTTRRSLGILIALTFCMALQMTGFAMILPLFARRFESFGAGAQALAMSALAYAFTTTLATPFIGMLADRRGRRPILLFSLVGYVLTFGGYLLAASAWQLVWLRGLAGALTAGVLPAITAIVGDVAPENRRAQRIGIVIGGGSAGWIAGPLLGGLLYDRFGYVLPFSAATAFEVGALLLALLWIPETYTPAAQPGQRRSAWRHGLRALPYRSTFALLLLITFGVMFAWAFSEPQLMFYAYDDLSWTSTQLGWVISAFGVTFTLGELVLGHLSDRLGRKPVLVLGLALFAAQFVAPVVSRSVPWIVLGFMLAGLGNALFDPALSALILDIASPEHSAGMLGLNGTAAALGRLLGPALVVLFPMSPRMVFLIAAAFVGVLTLASALALRTPEKATWHSSGAVAAQ